MVRQVKGLEVSRDRFTQAAAVLEKIIEHPQRSPSRIFASEGANYNFLNRLLSSGLVQVYFRKNRRQLILTDKGREFLQAYRMCEKLAGGTPQSIN